MVTDSQRRKGGGGGVAWRTRRRREGCFNKSFFIGVVVAAVCAVVVVVVVFSFFSRSRSLQELRRVRTRKVFPVLLMLFFFCFPVTPFLVRARRNHRNVSHIFFSFFFSQCKKEKRFCCRRN